MMPIRKLHPILKSMSQSLMDLPAPINISLWWNYGSLLGLFLMIQITSGIFLSMHYTPNIELAFFSLTHIMRNVNYGWLLHNMHMNGASLFMLFLYLHMSRSIYYSSYYMKQTWNIGVTIFILSMVISFMGYVLPWGQMSFWGATVITNIFSAMPYFGTQLVQWLWGGFAVSNPTLNRFFILHFIMPMILLFMVILHMIMLHQSGSNNPLGVDSNCDRIPFHIYFSLKDIMGFIFSIILLTYITMLNPNYLSDPENFMEANPLMTPNHIQPEWYFLWLYAILRSVPNKLGGVVALLLAIFILYLPPMYNTHSLSMMFQPLWQSMFFTMLTSWLILSWIGSCPVETPFIQIGQMSSTIYFSYFLLMPNLMNLWNYIMK